MHDVMQAMAMHGPDAAAPDSGFYNLLIREVDLDNFGRRWHWVHWLTYGEILRNARPDAGMHFASLIRVDESVSDREKYYRNHVTAAQILLVGKSC